MRFLPAAALRTFALLGIGTLFFAGCAASDSPTENTDTASSSTLTISAAASLQRSFDEIARQFTAAHPQTHIATIAYDGSSTLATQIVEGAPVDVFASADEKNMAVVTEAGLGRPPAIFATNTLVIAVPAGNPGKVQSLDDLTGVTTVLCAPQVPCGSASAKLLENQGVQVQAASLEQNVTAVLAKVSAGEADAGLVYATDVLGQETVESVVPTGAEDVVNFYPITALSEQPGAQDFVDFVLGETGQRILKEHGFGTPAGDVNG